MTKEKLQNYSKELATLSKNNNYFYSGDHHEITLQEIDEAIDFLDDSAEFTDWDNLIDSIVDNVSEIADSATPIYYADIAKWFSSNWQAVDEYIAEMGQPDDFDIMKIIQGAYYVSYERDLRNGIQKLVEEYESDQKNNEND